MTCIIPIATTPTFAGGRSKNRPSRHNNNLHRKHIRSAVQHAKEERNMALETTHTLAVVATQLAMLGAAVQHGKFIPPDLQQEIGTGFIVALILGILGNKLVIRPQACRKLRAELRRLQEADGKVKK